MLLTQDLPRQKVNLDARARNLQSADQLAADHARLKRIWQYFLIRERRLERSGSTESSTFTINSLVAISKLSDELLRTYSARILTLLEVKPRSEWDATDYDFAIRAAFFLREKTQINVLYRRALNDYKEHFATPTLLRLSVELDLWGLAINALKSYRNTAHDEDHFWSELHTTGLDLDSIIKKTVNILSRTKNRRDDDDSVLYREFACKLLQSFYNNPQTDLDSKLISFSSAISLLNLSAEGVRLLNFSPEGELPTKDQFQSLIHRLVTLRGRPQLAVNWAQEAHRIYNFTRDKNLDMLDEDVLRLLFYRMCDHHIEGVQSLFEDIKRQYGIPPDIMYRRLLFELAARGNGTAFSEYLAEMQRHFGQITSPLLLLRLIQYHGTHGEIKEMIELFRSLKPKFNVDPNTECWNAVIGALARTGNIAEALKWASQMAEKGYEPNEKTLNTFLKYYCHRGDLRSAEKVMEDFYSRGLKIDAHFVANVVNGHIQLGDGLKAQEVVYNSTGMNIDGNITEIWNMLMVSYALRGNVETVNKIRRAMQHREIPLDEWSYAALMTILCTTGFPALAFKILRALHADRRLKVYPFHFPIVFGGYMRTQKYNEVFEVLRWMLKHDFKPDWVAKTLMVKAAAKLDIWCHDQSPQRGKLTLDRAEEILEFVLSTAKTGDLVMSRPLKGVGLQPIQEAYSSNYFEFLIFIYGQAGADKKVAELYDKYTNFAAKHQPDQPVSAPLKMLSALMAHHRRQGNWDDIERYWRLAVSKADPLARKADAPEAQSNWVLASRKYILSLPLIHYMKALVSQNRIADLEPLIASLHEAGFDLDSGCWNLYIQTIALAGEHYKAFRLCEKLLMPGWGGWPKGDHSRFENILGKTKPAPFEGYRRVPNYRTMVVLTRSYMEMSLRTMPSEVDKAIAQLKKVAPKAVEAVLDMPSRHDTMQKLYLSDYKSSLNA